MAFIDSTVGVEILFTIDFMELLRKRKNAHIALDESKEKSTKKHEMINFSAAMLFF